MERQTTPKEIFKHIRRIEIKTGKLVDDFFSGQYESVFKGRGMEFWEVREYQPGDDIRTIDWNVTARFGRPFVKKFIEERELTVILLVDVSGSQTFASVNKLKSELAGEIASILAFSAIRNNDKVGLIIFTDKIERVVLPKKGRKHILRIIRDILYFTPESRKTDISVALEYLNEIWRKKAVVFLISDFLQKGFEKALKITNKRHDLIGIVLEDPKEIKLPSIGFINFQDNETLEQIVINTYDRELLNKIEDRIKKEKEERERLFKKINLDYIKISTDRSYVEPLINFFQRRAQRLR